MDFQTISSIGVFIGLIGILGSIAAAVYTFIMMIMED